MTRVPDPALSGREGGARPWDAALMRGALDLGLRHLGRAWPNPSVGAILVREEKDGPVVLARGITMPGGRPHAERVALDRAGETARGATLYVSLEPCSHHGRTPPCADAIVAAGLARVVTAIEDPDARVAGQGHARLRAAGIAVTSGVLAEEAVRAHRGHLTRVTQGRPAVIVKLAMTPDGYAAAPIGSPRLRITGPAMDARTHLLRSHADGVMIGVGTLMADDPRLDVRLPGMADRTPVRIVLDTHLRAASQSWRLLADAKTHPVWFLAGEGASAEAEAALRTTGAEVMRVPAAPDGRIDLAVALAALAGRGLTQILCEGGPVLAEALAAAGLVDEIVRLTGGEGTKPVAGARHGFGPTLAASLDRWTCISDETAGLDRLERFERPDASARFIHTRPAQEAC